MRIVFDTHNFLGKQWPIVKVDGQAIKNAIVADDVAGFVEYVKHNKIRTIRGKVEIS